MSERIRVICSENVELPGTESRRLTFTPSLDIENSVNGDFFTGTPGGELQIVGASPEVAEKYEVGQEYHIDIVLARTP